MVARQWRGLRLVDVGPEDVDEELVLDADSTVADSSSAESFDAFYLREFPRLVTLARALAGDAHAQDIAQEALVVAYGKWAEVSRYASPGGWVRGVCSHKALASVRRSAAERRALDRLRFRRPTAVADPPGEDDALWREVRSLPERQAQATALFYALDLSVADIAITLECSEGTVKSHLSRARATLADRLGVNEGVQS